MMFCKIGIAWKGEGRLHLSEEKLCEVMAFLCNVQAMCVKACIQKQTILYQVSINANRGPFISDNLLIWSSLFDQHDLLRHIRVWYINKFNSWRMTDYKPISNTCVKTNVTMYIKQSLTVELFLTNFPNWTKQRKWVTVLACHAHPINYFLLASWSLTWLACYWKMLYRLLLCSRC